MTPVRLRGRWTIEDRLARQVHEVAVEPPAGTRALTVELSYDRAAGVLDLGCAGPGGFRGWSGGARAAYTIAPGWATPGYLPGEIEPGVWRVLTGLYRVPLEGLAYEITVTPHAAPPPPPAPVDPPPPGPRPEPAAARRGLPGLDGMRWRAGELHAHTVHSDGALTVPGLAALARDQGLDFLAVTDHNTVSHHAELPGVSAATGVTLIPGQEVTTDLGHANAFGAVGWVDFREPADAWVRDVAARGGVLSVNHPLGADCAWRHPLAERPGVAEVWHSGWWDRTWGAPLSWAQAWRDDLVVVGGGDYHGPDGGHPPGAPATWVLSAAPGGSGDPGGEGVLDGVRAGRTAVSAGPGGPLLLRHGDEFLAVDADGLILWGPDRRQVIRGDRVAVPAAPGHHRLETTRNEVMALCT
ncbi:CehA/McbA family metallohydrolase [Sphaerisporangium aureirubrum]|uniref:CehA/McbA family metallohydrolase n=1 Tax=Sphaerisporangium aureirubrum TaxID=1544736 RepID=A0ABW1NK79_9ACTN